MPERLKLDRNGIPTRQDVARIMDHAILKPELTRSDLSSQIEICLGNGIGCACVRPYDVSFASKMAESGSLKVAAVVGFPHGGNKTEVKAMEAREAISDGASELDMVMNIGMFISGEHEYVRDDIARVVEEAKKHDCLVKVILETCFLSPIGISAACRLSEEAGADFVKTSTGFGPKGATPEAVRIMLESVGDKLGIKASGGIRTWDDAVMYIRMGCSRLGVGDPLKVLEKSPDRIQ